MEGEKEVGDHDDIAFKGWCCHCISYYLIFVVVNAEVEKPYILDFGNLLVNMEQQGKPSMKDFLHLDDQGWEVKEHLLCLLGTLKQLSEYPLPKLIITFAKKST